MAVVILKSPKPLESKYAKHLVSTPAKAAITVTTKHKGASGVESASNPVVHKGVVTEGTPAMVTVGGGQTINTGDFTSVKISISLSMPSPSDPDSLENTFQFASDWVSAKMEAVIKELGA